MHTLSAQLKGRAGLLDLIFYPVSQHTIRQSAASDPCNLSIAGSGVWGSGDGDKYVIAYCNSVQHLFTARLLLA